MLKKKQDCDKTALHWIKKIEQIEAVLKTNLTPGNRRQYKRALLKAEEKLEAIGKSLFNLEGAEE